MASDEYEIRIEKTRMARIVWLGSMIVMLSLHTVFGYDTDLPYPMWVLVVRRRDGDVVARFRHSWPDEAEDYAEELRERLQSHDAASFLASITIGNPPIPPGVPGAGGGRHVAMHPQR